jgi:transposase
VRPGVSRARRRELELFAQSLCGDDHVALETTGNALSIARILEPHVGGVLVADTRHVRAMTHAKVKNDRFDAQLLAKLLAAGMLPGTWICDEQTRILRRRISRRSQLVRGRTRARNQIHAVVIRNLGGRAPGTHTFSKKGRDWLAALELPADDRAMVDSCLREADFLTREVAHLDREIAIYALGSAEIRRLMTIPGVDVTTAATLMATIGRIDRFPSARHLVGYIGLDTRSRHPASQPFITATSPSRARPPNATCSARPRTPRCAPPAHCARSGRACARGAAATSPRSPSLVSLCAWRGNC